MTITTLEARKLELEAAIKESEERIAPVREELRQVLNDIAIERSPFKPGDIVQRKHRKTIEHFQISRIDFRWGWLHGYQIKKNGEPGSLERALYSADGYTLVKSAAESGSMDEESMGRR